MKAVLAITTIFCVVIILFSTCSRSKTCSDGGEKLAKIYCTTCHMETPPDLLDKKTWTFDVLPKMGPRLGMHRYKSLHYQRINPALVPPMPALRQEQWEQIVDYFYSCSPVSLPEQHFDKEPEMNCKTFEVSSFTDDISSSSIITMIQIDALRKCVYAGDVNKSIVFKFDYRGNLLDTMLLPSPPTAMRIEREFLDVTLAGILHPNNEPRGQVVRYFDADEFQKQTNQLIIDSIFRPVTSLNCDFNYDGLEDYLVCEYGHDIGRLSIYYATHNLNYDQYIIENVAGSIMVKTHDFNKDGFEDIVALFAQGDEKIVIYYNDGKGNFRGNFTLAARFPAVYGSMYIDIYDFNRDGNMDILYVNGDNFDYSQILKPYHGIRLLENDGANNFKEKYFYPIYGAGKAVIVDFDMDQDFDIMVTSNFADMESNPERGIIYLENIGPYQFRPYSFRKSAQNQWNTMATLDYDADGDVDVIIGAMNLENVLKIQHARSEEEVEFNKSSLLLMENKTY